VKKKTDFFLSNNCRWCRSLIPWSPARHQPKLHRRAHGPVSHSECSFSSPAYSCWYHNTLLGNRGKCASGCLRGLTWQRSGWELNPWPQHAWHCQSDCQSTGQTTMPLHTTTQRRVTFFTYYKRINKTILLRFCRVAMLPVTMPCMLRPRWPNTQPNYKQQTATTL